LAIGLKKMKIKIYWKFSFIFYSLAVIALIAANVYLSNRIPEDNARLAIRMLAIFMLILGTVLTYAVAIFISKPIKRMSKAARLIARGDFNGISFMRANDEIGELAAAMDHLSGEIKEKKARVDSEAAKLDMVLSGMLEGVIVTDKSGEIISMNPSLRKLFLIDTQSIAGKRPLEVIRNNSVQDMADRILKQKERLATQEITIAFPEEKILKVNAVPIISSGELEGAILVFHDITELRRLEKVRQEFVANVSHELRTPISSIKGYAETLLEGAIDDQDNARDFLNIIYQDSQRLAALIDDLLDLSKIESGKLKMVFLNYPANALIIKCAAVMENQAKAKAITIKLEIPDNLAQIKVDETRFSQVMINLLDNAVKYTPEKGTVNISARPEGNYLQIDISDTGIGIPEQDIPRIFERFYRVDKARSRELGGTGLGLSIVKHIVQAHGGQVWVKSEPGRGSTFSFTIPLA